MWTNLHWAECPWPGRLALAARPRGGDWLADELSRWRLQGIDVVCSLLEQHEYAELDLLSERSEAIAIGMRFESFAIRDRDVPESEAAFKAALRRLDTHLEAGRNVVVHCRQGVGRSGLVAAGLMIMNGLSLEAALRRIALARGEQVPETVEQLQWLRNLADKA